MDVPDVGPIAYSRDPMIQSKVNNVAATFSVQSVFFFLFMVDGNLASTCGVQLAYIYDSTWGKITSFRFE
jgi:hypothetical protein